MKRGPARREQEGNDRPPTIIGVHPTAFMASFLVAALGGWYAAVQSSVNFPEAHENLHRAVLVVAGLVVFALMVEVTKFLQGGSLNDDD